MRTRSSANVDGAEEGECDAQLGARQAAGDAVVRERGDGGGDAVHDPHRRDPGDGEPGEEERVARGAADDEEEGGEEEQAEKQRGPVQLDAAEGDAEDGGVGVEGGAARRQPAGPARGRAHRRVAPDARDADAPSGRAPGWPGCPARAGSGAVARSFALGPAIEPGSGGTASVESTCLKLAELSRRARVSGHAAARRPMALRGGSLTLLLRGVDANLSGTDGDPGQLVMQRASEPPRWGVEDASKDASDGTAGASEGAFDAVSGVGARRAHDRFPRRSKGCARHLRRGTSCAERTRPWTLTRYLVRPRPRGRRHLPRLCAVALAAAALAGGARQAGATVTISTDVKRTELQRSDAQYPLWISREDCLTNNDLEFTLTLSGFSTSDTLAIWVSESLDCLAYSNRDTGTRCKQVSAQSNLDATMVVKVSAKAIAEPSARKAATARGPAPARSP